MEKEILLPKKTAIIHGKKVEFFDVPSNRRHPRYLVDGEASYGCTTLTSLLQKDALMYGAARENMRHVYRKIKENTKTDENGNQYISTDGITKMFADIDSHFKRVWSSATSLGTSVHNTAEEFFYFKKGEKTKADFISFVDKTRSELPTEKMKEQYDASLSAFAEWYEKNVDELLAAEYLVYNDKLGYCTQIDTKYRSKITGLVHKANFKTSKLDIDDEDDITYHEETDFQLALEAMAEAEDVFDVLEIIMFAKQDQYRKDKDFPFLTEDENNPDAIPVVRAGQLFVFEVKDWKRYIPEMTKLAEYKIAFDARKEADALAKKEARANAKSAKSKSAN